MKIPRYRWRWFGLPAHFICGHQCVFHLATAVGGTLISTLGDMRRSPHSREPEKIGAGRLYETAVSRNWAPCADPSCPCGGQPTGSDWEIVAGYMTAGEAQKGHEAECEKAAVADGVRR